MGNWRRLPRLMPPGKRIGKLCDELNFIGCPTSSSGTVARAIEAATVYEDSISDECWQQDFGRHMSIQCASEFRERARLDATASQAGKDRRERYSAWENEQIRITRVQLAGVDGAKRLPDLSLKEKRLLCLQQVASHHRQGAGLEYPDGMSFKFLILEECVAEFPTCLIRVDEVPFVSFARERNGRYFESSKEEIKTALTGSLGQCTWGLRLSLSGALLEETM